MVFQCILTSFKDYYMNTNDNFDLFGYKIWTGPSIFQRSRNHVYIAYVHNTVSILKVMLDVLKIFYILFLYLTKVLWYFRRFLFLCFFLHLQTSHVRSGLLLWQPILPWAIMTITMTAPTARRVLWNRWRAPRSS